MGTWIPPPPTVFANSSVSACFVQRNSDELSTGHTGGQRHLSPRSVGRNGQFPPAPPFAHHSIKGFAPTFPRLGHGFCRRHQESGMVIPHPRTMALSIEKSDTSEKTRARLRFTGASKFSSTTTKGSPDSLKKALKNKSMSSKPR